MAVFKQSYLSEQAPEQLWEVINTPIYDPDIAAIVHEDFDVTYGQLNHEGLIDITSTITYVPTEKGKAKVPGLYRDAIPKDGTFFVARMSPAYKAQNEVLRHDILDSGKAEGWVTRTVEAEPGYSVLTVEAEFTLNVLGNLFEKHIEQALEHVFGGQSERTVTLGPYIIKG